MTKVVLDAMGGDHAPDAVLDALAISLERGVVSPDEILLVGPRDLLERRLEERGMSPDRYSLVDAPDVLTEDESPVEAMRSKPRNSVAVGIDILKQKQAQAFVSAGSTGLVVATATLGLRCLEGIRRPGIAVIIEGEDGPFMVIDVGANPQPKATHLLQYGLMGAAYFRDTYDMDQPRVGLLNIGSEDKKGNALTKEASRLLKDAPINFIGNIEGVDVFSGACDVVVCDGFSGNVLLKVSEGVAEYVLRAMTVEMKAAQVDDEIVRKIVEKTMRRVHYEEVGGALLLGVEGIVTICHGRSQGPAIFNAIRIAAGAVGVKVNQHIVNMAKNKSSTTWWTMRR